MVWHSAGDASLILPDVRFDSVFQYLVAYEIDHVQFPFDHALYYTGCVLKIDNGEATVTRSLGTTFVIEYTCNTGYHISLNSNKQTRICIDGNMLVKPSPCVG